jgi:hypothetical protein
VTNDVLNAAMLRAFLISLVTGALTTLTTRQLDVGVLSPSWEDALTAGGVAFLTTFLARGFGEGGYDSHRASVGDANAGDVPVASDKLTVEKVG